MEFNHDLKSFDNIFLCFDNKNKLKNYIKLNKNNIKFFINLKIYTESNSPFEMEYNKNSIKNLKGEINMKTINFYKSKEKKSLYTFYR